MRTLATTSALHAYAPTVNIVGYVAGRAIAFRDGNGRTFYRYRVAVPGGFRRNTSNELEIDEVTRLPMRHEPDYFTVFASDMGDTGRIDRLTPGTLVQVDASVTMRNIRWPTELHNKVPTIYQDLKMAIFRQRKIIVWRRMSA